jgi:primosomal protein N' (replication factor Y)
LTLVSVVFPVPLHREFTYALSEGRPPPAPGTRVLAAFARRRAVGFVTGSPAEAPAGIEPQPLGGVLDPEPSFSPALWALGRWIAAYYAAPLGLVLKAMLPPALLRLRRGRAEASLRALAAPTRTFVEAVAAAPPELSRRAPARARALAALVERGGPVDALLFREESGTRAPVLAELARAGLVRLVDRPVAGPRPVGAAPRGEAEHPLTPDQERALEAIRAAAVGRGVAPGLSGGNGRPRAGGTPSAGDPHDGGGAAAPGSRAVHGGDGAPPPVLLHGVTGSGKTLVYLRLVEEAVRGGGRAIVLVPEIGLTPRTAARFEEAFAGRVAVLHSALSEGERLEAWRAMREGEIAVAVGARSAVFAPLADVRVIVVDEEHESGYKQDETPRYQARDAALVRARLEGALALLGSATPSLETYANAQAGKHLLVELPRRIGDRALPAVEVVDLRGRPPEERILSRPLREALGGALDAGRQGLLLLNRRGFSAYLQCVDCGTTAGCPACRITLTLHRPRGRGAAAELRCHYCDHREPAPDVCRDCGGLELEGRGLGTQQVEDAAREAFPRARIARMDHDTTGRKGAHRTLVEAMERGDLDVLVGTQMIAKGHDFPRLDVVGVISADTGLNVPDFRAAERTFQLLAQVAGRPGRGPAPGRVLVQTYVPGHPAIAAAAAHDYDAFYRGEVAQRFEAGYPPAVKLARCLLSGEDEAQVADAARAVARDVQALVAARGLAEGERLAGLGPAAAPLARLRGRWRWHYLLKSTSPPVLDAVLGRLATRWRPPRGVQLALDRDPAGLL